MIDLLLNREPRKIVLDRLLYLDDNNEYVYTIDPVDTEREAIKHFQNASANNQKPSNRSLNPFQSHIYRPRTTIPSIDQIV